MIDVIDRLQADVVTHEITAAMLGLTAAVSFFLTWFLARSQRIAYGTWWPKPKKLGWALAHFIFWFGVLLAALSLIIMNSAGELPVYGLVIIIFLFVSAILLFRAFAREEKGL